MAFVPSQLIQKKKRGSALTADEIRWFVDSYTSGVIPDYQMAAWAMAVWFKGMNDDEIAVFTDAMLKSGSRFNFSKLGGPRIDKHSTGGIGDKTSIIVGPILAAAKVYAPMIAGRGLGHTGGTLDKLEGIPGFRVTLSRQEFELTRSKKLFLNHESNLKIFARLIKNFMPFVMLTSTVDSLPLICGSKMSKKLAEDLTGLVLDVKFGTGALMKSVDSALKLAALLKTTGEKMVCV